jgi:hypothetical protein
MTLGQGLIIVPFLLALFIVAYFRLLRGFMLDTLDDHPLTCPKWLAKLVYLLLLSDIPERKGENRDDNF